MERSGCLKWAAVLVAIPVVLAGLVMFFGWSAYEAVMPEPAAADLAKSEPLAVRTLDVREEGEEGCSVRVQVFDATGEPMPGVDIEVRGDGDGSRWRALDVTGDRGAVVLEDLDCGDVHVEAYHPTLAAYSRDATLKAGAEALVRLALQDAIEVTGTVTSPDGTAIEGAVIEWRENSIGHTTSDSSGRYAFNLPRHSEQHHTILYLTASAFGFEESTASQHIYPEAHPADTGSRGKQQADTIEVDFSLEPARSIRVHCRGRRNDRCNQTVVMCTAPLLPFGQFCNEDPATGDTVCNCKSWSGGPEHGEVAIRANGVSTLVAPGENDAWLDFRGRGVITGRVEVGGVPTPACQAFAVRVPGGPLDVTTGILSVSDVSCTTDGTITFTGLGDGDWEIVIEAQPSDMDALTYIHPPTSVREGRTTDLGTIEVFSNGAIEGILVDGLTGEPRSGETILAIRPGEGSARSTPMVGQSKGDGTFEIKGLPPGTWTLRSLSAPFGTVDVVVEEGAITDGVELRSSRAPALETNGFSLGMEDGELVVEDVRPGSPADEAGMEPGDRVVTALMGGIDLFDEARKGETALTMTILSHWGGPGITLVLERDGEEVEVPLAW